MFSEKKAGELGDLNHKNRFSVNNSPSQPRLSEQKKKQILSQNRVHKEMINANAHHLRCLSHTLGALSAGIQDFCCLLHNDFNLLLDLTALLLLCSFLKSFHSITHCCIPFAISVITYGSFQFRNL